MKKVKGPAININITIKKLGIYKKGKKQMPMMAKNLTANY